jgi:hypothetical protein
MSRARIVAALAAAAALAVGGCSASYSGSSGSDVCGSADALRTSVGDLEDVQIAQDGTAALQQAFSKVGDDVDRLVNDAHDQYSGQVADVQSAMGELGTALDSLGSAPTAATLGAAGAAARTLVQDAGALVDAVSSSC